MKRAELPYALRSFIGYLEGTGKSAHTIQSYRSDLRTFEQFLLHGLGRKKVSLTQINHTDLDRYYDYLKELGLKTNSRRRKLLTVRRFLRYLTRRNKIGVDIGDRIPAPYKVEKVPAVVDAERLLKRIKALPPRTPIEARNRLLLWVLAETGCLVSEVGQLRPEDWSKSKGKWKIQIPGKNARGVSVSSALFEAFEKVRATQGEQKWLFLGFNKFGPLTGPISSRGVELLAKAYAKRLKVTELTPRMIRHSAVVAWHRQGMRQDEMQARLGLKSDYAFRFYAPLFKVKSKKKTTSSSGKKRTES